MSCPRTKEVDRTLSPEQLRAFCDHARTCEDCGVLLDRVALAYQSLRAEAVPALSPSRRVELLARVEAAAEKPRFELRWPFAAVALLAVGVLVIASWPADSDPLLIRGQASVGRTQAAAGDALAIRQPIAIRAGSRLEYGRAALEIDRDAGLSFDSGPELIAMQLADGRVRFDLGALDRAQSFSVSTALARFESVGVRFLIDAKSERVELQVEAGEVRAIPADGGAVRTVSAGEAISFERKPLEPPEPTAALVPAQPPPPAPAVALASVPKPRVAPKEKPASEPIPAVEVTPPLPTVEARLDEARQVVTRDAVKARDLAQGVLEENPSPRIEISALLVLADAHRRTGAWSQAADAYRKVAAHVNGAPYAEEALVRRAQILALDGDGVGALTALADAERRFPHGTLAPERSVLEAQLRLARGEALEAAAALERVGPDRTLAVLRARVEVAEALVARSPERARALAAAVLASNAPRDLIVRAEMIVSGDAGNR